MCVLFNSYIPDRPPIEQGDVYTWEANSAHARCVVQVIEVFYNGEEWWVLTETLEPTVAGDDLEGQQCWNDAGRFLQAATPGRWSPAWAGL